MAEGNWAGKRLGQLGAPARARFAVPQGIAQTTKFIIARSTDGNRVRADVCPGTAPAMAICPVARREIALHQGGALRPSYAFG
jgi:hypothetical protein